MRRGLNGWVMFFSPCTRRSTQCAALIALATVAGIARIESNPQKTNAANALESNPCFVPASGPGPAHFTVSPKWSAPWLQPLATLALWFLSTEECSELNPAAASSEPGSAPDADATLTSPRTFPALPIGPTATPEVNYPEPRILTGSRSHLVPFAVGPPRTQRPPNLRAKGTPVPKVDFARRFYDVSIDHFSVRIFARLACRSVFGHPWVGPFIPRVSSRVAHRAHSLLRFVSIVRSARMADGRRLFPL